MNSKKAHLILVFILMAYLHTPQQAHAYSVLTHQAIIDAVWRSSFQPVLVKRFPHASEADLKKAHAFAYGGALIPDMGYFPLGSEFYTNLLHYVRSGDFITALIEESRDLNEYAFALGALSHYYADHYGHSLGTNKAVPLVYPETRKHGHSVTYEDDPLAHTRTEFGFDVLQTARGSYAHDDYHEFIGFQIAQGLLERAFLKTYGLDIHSVFASLTLSINTFRWSVRQLFPRITRVAWSAKKGEIREKQPGITARNFRYKMSRKEFNRTFERERNKPGFFSGLTAVLITILPKIGPLRPLKFKVPGPEAEKLFIQSFDTVTLRYAKGLVSLPSTQQALANLDFDTGNITTPGEYRLADETYQILLLELHKKKFVQLNEPLRQNMLRFFNHKNYLYKGESGEKIKAALKQLSD